MIALEQLADGSISDRNFQALVRFVLDTGGKSLGVRIGTALVTFTASTTSANTTVNHGLGRTPIVVLATANSQGIIAATGAYGATSFVVNGQFASSISATVGVVWVAIG